MTKLWPALLLIAGLLPGCAAPPGPSTTAPASQAAATGVVYWQYVRSTSYEARQPGLGISHRYESRVGWVDVYVYDLKQGNWLPGVDDPRFDEHFSATVNEVRLAGASGIYAKVEVGRVSDVRIEEQTLRRVSFRVLHAASGKSYESLTFLTARNGRLLKYRMSFAVPAPPDVDAIAREFIAQNLRSEPDRPRASPPFLTTWLGVQIDCTFIQCFL